MPPTIRPLRRTDHPEWFRMRRTLWPDCSPAMHRLEMKEQSARSRLRAVLVLDRGDGLGGFIELSVRSRVDGSLSPRVGFVEGWYLDPDLRRQGWGRRLITAAQKWTTAHGLTELASDAELADSGSIAAHHACGFRETFRLVHFLRKIRKQD